MHRSQSSQSGGISAFKFNQRQLDVDEQHRHYGVTPAEIVRTLTTVLKMLKGSHPLHIHTAILGVPGNYRSTIATIDAAAGHPLLLAHAQFHSYGKKEEKIFFSLVRNCRENQYQPAANARCRSHHVWSDRYIFCRHDASICESSLCGP